MDLGEGLYGVPLVFWIIIFLLMVVLLLLIGGVLYIMHTIRHQYTDEAVTVSSISVQPKVLELPYIKELVCPGSSRQLLTIQDARTGYEQEIELEWIDYETNKGNSDVSTDHTSQSDNIRSRQARIRNTLSE